MKVLNIWQSLASRLSYPSSKSRSNLRPIGKPSIDTFTNNVRRRRADAVRALLLRNGLIGGQSESTWFLHAECCQLIFFMKLKVLSINVDDVYKQTN
jgi:hypothetical protein